MKSGIYTITHIETGRCYVGSSVNVERRFKEHRIRLNNGSHPCAPLLNAWRKYGADAFHFVIVEVVDLTAEEDRIERENHWIGQLQPAFNIAPVAGSVLGLKRSDETRKRMAQAQTDRYANTPSPLKGRERPEEVRKALRVPKKPRTEEHRAKLSSAAIGRPSPRKGVKLSEETKRRISESKRGSIRSVVATSKAAESNRGRKRTEEQRQRMSAAKKGKPLTAEHRAKLSEAAKFRCSRKKVEQQ